ncbi:di-heme oxidoredictase family protein [Roseomonas sp. CAU 1739]|uniref:di-heme oxidoreductase family protein n=1 Tax=Roseomonas sp. CAU 1739 TaxID=3140364 RepID=UPI00325C247D
MRRVVLLAGAVLLTGALSAQDGPEPAELLPGSAATVHVARDARAFSLSSATLPFDRQLDFRVGDGVFRKLWVSAPSSTTNSDGLGPLYNARGCQSCHLRDGRGRPPEAGEAASSLLVRIGAADGSPDPVYGGQLQTFGIQGHPAEGRVHPDWTEEEVALAGGEVAHLRRPHWRIDSWGYGDPMQGLRLSARSAPPMIGLGLLEAIPEAEIVAGADPDDRNHDGIRGRAAFVPSAFLGRAALGRFGWKALAPTMEDQIADAFRADMGLSTTLHPEGFGECTAAQVTCRGAPTGGEPEVDPRLFDLTVFYARNLGVPARTAPSPQVLRGRTIFRETGCSSCHRPSFTTGQVPGRPEHSAQRIWPYTDMLLHDMGDGLADDRAEGAATGREWRTPPLWGLGFTRVVSGHTQLLHDGRARNALEAILWHGGEAQAARNRVVGLPPADRAALLAFLDSL